MQKWKNKQCQTHIDFQWRKCAFNLKKFSTKESKKIWWRLWKSTKLREGAPTEILTDVVLTLKRCSDELGIVDLKTNAFDIFVRDLKSRYGSRGRLQFYALRFHFYGAKMRLRRILRPLTRPRAEKWKVGARKIEVVRGSFGSFSNPWHS